MLMKATNKSMPEADSQTEQVQRDQLIVARLEWVRLVTVKILLELHPGVDDNKSFPSIQKQEFILSWGLWVDWFLLGMLYVN